MSELEPKSNGGEGGERWVPRMYLADGRQIGLTAFSCGTAGEDPHPQAARVLDKLRELAGLPLTAGAASSELGPQLR